MAREQVEGGIKKTAYLVGVKSRWWNCFGSR
jgi:hypothetical protein